MGSGGYVRRDVRDDSGGAVVEFVALSVLLLIPLVYLVVTVSRIQAGILAAEAAAHDAARAVVVEGVRSLEQGRSHAAAFDAGVARAEALVTVQLDNFGFERDDARVAVGCTAEPCLSLGSNITAAVEVDVALPGVPGFIGRALPLAVTVGGSASSPVDSLAGER